MKINSLIILIILCSDLHAQYLNKIFRITEDTANAKYYRHIDTAQGGGYIEKIYYLNDTLHSLTDLSSINPKIRNGKYIEYFDNGKIRLYHNYQNGKQNGKNFEYYDDGKLQCDLEYANGKLNGLLKSYYETGVLRRIDKYAEGEFIEGKCFGSKGQDTAYFIYFKPATFKNGDLEKYRNFVMSKLIYPPEAVEKNISGRVDIWFCVNSKGKVVDVEIVQSPDYYLSKAAVDAILSSPDWEPAIMEGKKVKQRFWIPIIFQLQ